MKNYQYILLDWDGNLAKTLHVWIEVYRIILNREGFYPGDEEIAHSFGGLTGYLVGLGFKDPDPFYEQADQLAKKMLPNVELYPDALEVLAYLKDKNKKTALVTTSKRTYIEHLLDRYEMHRLFDVVITHDDVTEHKPNPESLNKALVELGGNKDEAIMIGDSQSDLGAAVNAGVDSVLFYPPEHEKFYNLELLKQHKPTYIVDDFRKVIKIVR